MATVRYDPVPTVAPQPTAPTSYQRADTGAFQALAGLGDAATKAADFYNQAAVDDGFNKLQQHGTSLLYGSTTTGAAGQSAPVPGYMSLNGKAALDKRPQVQQSLDEQIDGLTNSFATPEQQQAFKQRAMAYRNGFFSQVGSHSNAQADVWYGAVNDATVSNQINALTANTGFNPAIFAESTKSIIEARVKQAELAGASMGDEVWNAAVSKGKQEATLAQTQALATVDPEKGLSFAAQNKDILGSQYDNVYTALRVRATAAAGDRLAQEQLDQYGGSVARPPAGAAAGEPDWLDTYFVNVKASESGGNANAKSATSSATGLYQFTAGTWRGLMGSHPGAGLTEDGRTDPKQQEIAVRLFTADNARVLSQRRVPITPGNLYLAAFFGAQGSAAIYDLPGSTPMEQAVGGDVIRANAWLRGKTVQDVRQWAANHAGKGIDTSAGGVGGEAAVTNLGDLSTLAPRNAPVDVGHPDNVLQFPAKVPGAPEALPAEAAPGDAGLPQGTQSTKAEMIQNVLDSDEPIEVKQHAISVINQMVQAQQIAADQTAAAKKAANETAAKGYMTRILSGDTAGIQQQIAQDQNLTYETQSSLSNALLAHADQSASAATASYGDGFWQAYQDILAAPDSPRRISDVQALFNRAAPGGDLTLAGVNKLTSIMTDARKSNDNAAVQKAKASLEAYAKSKLSNQEDPNPMLNQPGHKDPVGEAAFNGSFVPKFEAAFDAWVAQGKDPWEFLNRDNADKFMQGIRDPQEVAMQKILGGIPEYAGPPAPAGVDEKAWQSIVTHVPSPFIGQNGQPTVDWPGILTVLVSHPDPNTMFYFDQKYGKGNGFTAKDVLDALEVEPGVPPSANAPNAAPAAPNSVEQENQALRDSLPIPAGQ